jgi:uncharacterized protein YggE
MSRIACLATIAFFVMALSQSTHTQTPARTNPISVNGEAELRVVPDEVILSLGVETFSPILRTAKTENDERIKRTIAVARRYAVPAERIQTDYLSIEPRYRNGDIALERLGYVVRRTVVIRLSDVDKFEGLLTEALDGGVTHVHGVDFRTSELRRYRDEARTAAMKAAREKAALLSKELGHRVGDVLSISEASYGYFSSYGSWWSGRRDMQSQNVVQSFGGAALTSDTALAPGQISIRVGVSVSFSLE